jgi:hypothetical protein
MAELMGHSHQGHIDDRAGDVLEGAAEIAAFVFGTAAKRRRVYDLCERGVIPHFKMGRALCSRRSSLTRWMIEREECASDGPPPLGPSTSI